MRREPFVHTAVVDLPALDGIGALSGAISRAVCGSWTHDGPCPLAPHQILAELDGDRVLLRVLFATEASEEHRVRKLITGALAANSVTSPEGIATAWQLVRQEPAELLPAEAFDALRLVGGPGLGATGSG